MLRTKIVCTIGPASCDLETLIHLIEAGMDVARLNFSHGDHAWHAETISYVRAAAAVTQHPVAILADLQGPKLRVGQLPEGGVHLEPGALVTLSPQSIADWPSAVPVQFDQLAQAVQVGDPILLDDGLLDLRVREVHEDRVVCTVVTGGLLTSHKGMNLPNVALGIPAITDKDEEDLRFALAQGVDWVALSFVRQAEEVVRLRSLIERWDQGGNPPSIIAKIEKPEGVRNIDAIIAVADGIMVARGDLGIETAPEAVPMMQKDIIARCNRAGVPVITATQMLESMIRNPRPTRAEASDVANAILDGTDAIMLSGETAMGAYPIAAVATMARIAAEAERALKVEERAFCHPDVIAEAVAHASVDTARHLSAAAIIAPTVSGFTARLLSHFRPSCPIIAVTPDPVVQRRLTLYWGVEPLLAPRATVTDVMIADAVRAAQAHGYVQPGQTVVIVAGSAGAPPRTTDFMRVQKLI